MRKISNNFGGKNLSRVKKEYKKKRQKLRRRVKFAANSPAVVNKQENSFEIRKKLEYANNTLADNQSYI